MAGRIVGHVFPNAVQIVATPAFERCKLSGDERQHLKEFVGGFHRGVDDHFPDKWHAAGLGQESKRKTRGQAEALLLIAATAGKLKFEL